MCSFLSALLPHAVLHFPSLNTGNDLLCSVVEWSREETVTPQSCSHLPWLILVLLDQICSHLVSVEPMAQAEM